MILEKIRITLPKTICVCVCVHISTTPLAYFSRNRFIWVLLFFSLSSNTYTLLTASTHSSFFFVPSWITFHLLSPVSSMEDGVCCRYKPSMDNSNNSKNNHYNHRAGSSESEMVGLKRRVGLVSGTALIVGTMIGEINFYSTHIRSSIMHVYSFILNSNIRQSKPSIS